MAVLVVGASGAVGGAVVAGLLERGVDVRATSRTFVCSCQCAIAASTRDRSGRSGSIT